MITIFTIPKAFDQERIKAIQSNALQSWISLGNSCEIFLVGNDAGVGQAADEAGVGHVPDVAINEFGTPRLDSAFSLVRQKAKNDILMYINADIILFKDLLEALALLPPREFLAVGRRWDLDIKELIDFGDAGSEKDLRERIGKEAVLHAPSGIDYFIFRRESFKNLPEFAVGRVGWDNWMIREARRLGYPAIDCTKAVTAIHQNHDYPAYNKDALRKTNPEAKKNYSFTKSAPYFFTIEDCNYELADSRLKKRRLYWLPFLKRYLKYLMK